MSEINELHADYTLMLDRSGPSYATLVQRMIADKALRTGDTELLRGLRAQLVVRLERRALQPEQKELPHVSHR